MKSTKLRLATLIPIKPLMNIQPLTPPPCRHPVAPEIIHTTTKHHNVMSDQPTTFWGEQLAGTGIYYDILYTDYYDTLFYLDLKLLKGSL